MPIDLKKRTPSELKNLLANAQRLGNTEMAIAVVQEMHERKMATSREYATLPWNQDRVDEVMKSFEQVAFKVPNNHRKTYTIAGGRKIGLPKDSPDHFWIDSYSEIKILRKINAVFGCSIKKPGDDPEFTLYLTNISWQEAKPHKVYNVDQLPQALAEWEAIARSATSGSA
jgi:hypothetical protein